MNRKINILIQGPLLTFGQGPNISVKGFRSYDCVVDNTLLILSKGIVPVLCLWASDVDREEYKPLQELYKKHELSILILEIPGKRDDSHRYKHHFALYKGLEYCRSNFSCDFFIKIRTDQHISEEIINELVQFSADDKMLVSELMPDNNFYIGDFIYAGKYETVKKYLLSQVTGNEGQVIYSTTGNDLGFNYYRSWTPVSKWKLIMLYLFNAKVSTELWETFVNAHFITLTRDSWVTLCWRAKKMTDVVDPNLFLFVSDKQPVTLKVSKGISRHIYYVKGKYKRLAKKVAMKLIGK